MTPTHLTREQLREIMLELRLELQRLGGSPGSRRYDIAAESMARPPDGTDDAAPPDIAAARAAGAPERLLRVLEALSRIRTGRYGSC